MLRTTGYFILAVIFASISSGCGVQTENSSSQDAKNYAPTTGANDSVEFVAAKAIFASNCNGCHTFHTMTEAQMIASGRLVPGNPEGSSIYYRLIGSTGSGGPKNMPQAGSISATDVSAIRTWIANSH
jgi:mono/diheme cytochrome c family protein